jgi:nicotinamidase/pyrazinamidase
MRILIAVDVQKDFCPGGALAVPDGDGIVPLVNSLLKSSEFDLRVASKDWHPADHISFFDNHPGKQVFETIEVSGGAQTLWPRHCEQFSPGAELHEGLSEAAFDYVVCKGMNSNVDSYSAFYDNNRAQETQLRSIIEREAAARGVSRENVTLVVCGLALDYCVAATLRDAVELGFKCELVLDGCRAVNLNAGDDTKVLRDLISRGVSVYSSREVVQLNRRELPIQL